MTKPIRSTKMYNVGNDYIYADTMVYPIDNPEELSVAWSKPHTGIGSDGLVLIGFSDIVDFNMHIYNVDGSEAMMCGNMSRCIDKYIYGTGLAQKDKVTLETLSGIRGLQLKIEREEVTGVTVDMEIPAIGEIALGVEARKEIYTGTVISMGNLHLVISVDEMDKVDLAGVSPSLEYLPLFPDRTNAELVWVLKPGKIQMRMWERGSGITQACRTGTYVTTVAGVVRGKIKRKIKVIMDEGPLTIEWGERSGKAFMTGGAVGVLEGFTKV